MHKDVPGCFIVPMCQKSLLRQIRSYCKKPIACRTNRIVMHRRILVASLICCLKRRCQDKSDCIGIETCSVLHCAAVSSNIFNAVSIDSFSAISIDDRAAQLSTEHASMPIQSDLSRQRRLNLSTLSFCLMKLSLEEVQLDDAKQQMASFSKNKH